MSIYLPCLPCLPACLSVCLTVSLKAQLFCKTSSIFELDNIKNKTTRLPQFSNLTTSKANNSARLPQLLNLTTSKMKHVCETSSIFEVDNIKNETILQDFHRKWKVECRADGLVPMRFAIFPIHLTCLKYCVCREKVMPGHTKCYTCHAKSSRQT